MEKEMLREKGKFIKDLKTGEDFDGFFMVKNVALREGKNQTEYLDITLGDKTGEINGKRWSVTEDDKPKLSTIKEQDIVKVRAGVSEWNNQKQLRIVKIRKVEPEDNIDFSDFIKTAPEDPNEMYDYILGKAEGMTDGDFKKVCKTLLERNKERLLYYPAAAKNHHAEFGGLLWHMKRMLMSGEALCGIYTFLNKDLVLTGVIIHDMEKLNEIEANEMGMATGYSKVGQLLGHLVQGVSAMNELSKELGIPEEKALLMEHMIISHHYEPEFGSPKKPLFPEAEILHYLDIMDARMYDMEEAIQGVEPGGFSERVWTLDNRRIYKPEL